MSRTESDDPDRDDEALSWDGYDDPGLSRRPAGTNPTAPVAPVPHSEPSALRSDPASADAASVAGSASAGTEPHWALDETPEDPHPGVGNVALVAFGVLGGVYALLTIGWIIGALRLQGYALFFVAPVAFQVSMWLAVLAPAAWFTAVAVLTRSGRTWIRLLLLLAGALLLLPWPFIMVGTVGA
jgi:hypothetical protein